jgi:hypothetical protein
MGWEKAYPILDGLMATKDGGHDVACIFRSFRDFAECPPEERLEIYAGVCQLVRETRATIDPVEILLHKKEVEELFKAEPDAWPIGTPPPSCFEWLLSSLVLVWESFTWG